MREKTWACHPERGPPRSVSPAPRLDHAGLQENIKRALCQRNTPDLLDLGSGRRLVVGNDDQTLHCDPWKLACLGQYVAETSSQVRRGPEGPTIGHLDENHASGGAVIAEGQKDVQRLEIISEQRLQGSVCHRPRASEDEGFD